MKTLLLVDLQNDFVTGSLAVDGGGEVIDVANKLMSDGGYDLVVATQDWHPAGHKSFASSHDDKSPGDAIDLDGLEQMLWPDHCVQDTDGAAFCPGLDVGRIDEVVRKGTDPAVDSYSGFFDNGHRHATGLADLLRDRGAGDIDVMGLATDYCVRYTVLDALKLGHGVRLLADGCRAVDSAGGGQAIEAMKAAGAEVL